MWIKGSLFVAVEGIFTDGHSYIGKAIEQEASVVVYDKPLIEEYFSRVTYVQVEDSTVALALIASNGLEIHQTNQISGSNRHKR